MNIFEIFHRYGFMKLETQQIIYVLVYSKRNKLLYAT